MKTVALLVFAFLVCSIRALEGEDRAPVYRKGHLVFHDEQGSYTHLAGPLKWMPHDPETDTCARCRDCCCGWKDPWELECQRCRACWNDYSFDCKRPARDREDISETSDSCHINQSIVQTCAPVTCNCVNDNSQEVHLNATQETANNLNQTQDQNVSALATQAQRCGEQVSNLSCENTCNFAAMSCMSSCGDQCSTCTGPTTCLVCIQACINVCLEGARSCMGNDCNMVIEDPWPIPLRNMTRATPVRART